MTAADPNPRYSLSESPLGALLVAATGRGICAVSLGDDPGELERELLAQFPGARRVAADDPSTARYLAALLAYLQGKSTQIDLPLDVTGSPFQLGVWEELRTIPYGQTRTYTQLSQAIGRPGAVRAVASACGANPTALAIPCHRVLRGDGHLGGFRWGVERKAALLRQEGALL
jgi:AraC family transcriptional regulator, regulatory protein of adaptative response / methylated-DNA-[protein]-cysteine methyltransferase